MCFIFNYDMLELWIQSMELSEYIALSPLERCVVERVEHSIFSAVWLVSNSQMSCFVIEPTNAQQI
jgi:hypothetical protein